MKTLPASLTSAMLLLFLLGATAQAQQLPGKKGIDPETVAAYEKIGGIYESYRIPEKPFSVPGVGGAYRAGEPVLVQPKNAGEDAYPVFRFKELPKEKFPPVAVPFGLNLPFSNPKPAIDFKALAHLENLAILEARSSGGLGAVSPIKDAWLADLLALPNLRALSLYYADVTDAGMKHVAKLKNLTYLELSGTKVTPAGLRELAPLKKLTLLRCKVTDETLFALRDAELLHVLPVAKGRDETRPKAADEVVELDLTRDALGVESGVTRQVLPILKDFHNLESLNLFEMSPRDEGIKHLLTLSKLKKLNLNYGGVTDAGLKELAQLPEIAELHLTQNRITGKGLLPFKKLRKLDLFYTHIGENDIQYIAQLSTLTWLHLPGHERGRFSDVTAKELAKLEKLEHLDLIATTITDDGAKDLAKLVNMKELRLGAPCTDLGIQHLLTGMQQLEKLHLYARITDGSMKEVAKLKKLQTLEVAGLITDAGLKELAVMKDLKSLQVWSKGITKEGLAELRKALPECKVNPR